MTTEQQEQLDTILRNGGLDLSNDAQTLRAAFNEAMKYVPVAEDVEQHRTTVGGVDAIEVTIRGMNSSNVVLYFHGGVYVIGSSAATVPLASELARRADAKAITVDYRLAPEHPFPAALVDARAAYEGLLDQGFDPVNIALAGESAGSGLAVATLLELRDAGLPLPSCAFLMSPYADLTLSGETLLTKQAVDPILTLVGLRLRVSEYVGGANAADPRISPIFGDLRGLPPLLIQVGSHEILLSDALRLAAQAATSDVQVTLEVVPGVPHVFQGFAAVLDEGDAALNRAALFLKTQLAAAEPTHA
jgi:monoterpene epsilon-lactone hydrolase